MEARDGGVGTGVNGVLGGISRADWRLLPRLMIEACVCGWLVWRVGWSGDGSLWSCGDGGVTAGGSLPDGGWTEED